MSQTISVSTTMGEQGFRDFAVFDAFHHRKAWLRPAVFAAIMLAFAAVCLSQLGKRPGAGLLAAELADTGIAVWMYGQQDKPEPTSRHAWDSFYCAYRTDNAVYLYVEKEKAYLLNDRMEVVWKFLAGILPKEKLHDCRKA